MTVATRESQGPLFFCYAKPDGFSGQKAATELVFHGLAARGWVCRELPQPVLDRSGGRMARLRYALSVAAGWWRALVLLGSRGGRLWVGLGQTRASFLRDSVPLLLGRAGLGRRRVIVSLNGSLFMQWPRDSLDARLFRFLLNHAGTVVAVGEQQRRRLVALGVPAPCAAVVVNSCALEALSARALQGKLARTRDASTPVRCLFLSSLIDSKGYPEYLDALLRLSGADGPPVEAVLCGRIVASDFGRRFPDERAATEWIEGRIEAINAAGRVAIQWVQGAAGEAKAALFRDADIFVLPTYYAVEAQPLVLLEAMASGCAIITTRIAEIPTVLDESSALFVTEASTDSLVQSLQNLVADAPARERLARAAHTRFVADFQVGRHLDAWERVLSASRATRESP